MYWKIGRKLNFQIEETPYPPCKYRLINDGKGNNLPEMGH